MPFMLKAFILAGKPVKASVIQSIVGKEFIERYYIVLLISVYVYTLIIFYYFAMSVLLYIDISKRV